MNQKGYVNIVLIAVIVVLASVAGYFVLVKKSTPATQQTPTPTQTTTEAPVIPQPTPVIPTPNRIQFFKTSGKVSPLLAQLLAQIEIAGITEENADQFDMTQFNTPSMVHLDKHGNVQVYIKLDRLNNDDLAELEQRRVKIELTDEQSKIVQGWVPFYLLVEVAKIPNVRLVRPPDYAVFR